MHGWWGYIKKTGQEQMTTTFLIRSWYVCGGFYVKQWLWFRVEGYVASSTGLRVEGRAIDCGGKMLYGTFLSFPSPFRWLHYHPSACSLDLSYLCQSDLLKFLQQHHFPDEMQWNLVLNKMQRKSHSKKMPWNLVPVRSNEISFRIRCNGIMFRKRCNKILFRIWCNGISFRIRCNEIFKWFPRAVQRFFLQISGWPSFPRWQGVHLRDPRVCGDLDTG